MMGNRLNELIQKVKAERLAARRYVAMLLVLAMLTSISVSWRLHQVGTALTTDDEYYCGYEEHVHDDSCYTEELVCGYEEGEPIQIDSAFGVDAEEPAESESPAESEEPEEPKVEVHHHTEDCYKEVTELTCDEKEHTHGEECYDTETGELLCTEEEHTHDESCYTTTEELVCGYEEGEEIPVEDDASDAEVETYAEEQNTAAVVFDDPESLVVTEPEVHHHTEACYEKVLTCTIPEHTHTLECLANWGADVEDRDDWDQYGQGLSDYWGNDLVQVAIEQLGYKESEKNFTVDEALGEAIDVHHYTRYGQWYGNPYAAWDVMFVAFCQHYAGIPKDIIPQRAGLFALRTDLEAAHPEYLTAGGAKADWGQIVTYYNSDGDETIGIVETVDADTDELTVISGAVNGAVAEVTINRADITNTILVKQAWADYTGYDLDDDQDPDADTTDPADSEEPSDEQPSDDDVAVLPGEDETEEDFTTLESPTPLDWSIITSQVGTGNTVYHPSDDTYTTDMSLEFEIPRDKIEPGKTYVLNFPEGVTVPDKLCTDEFLNLYETPTSETRVGSYRYVKNADGTYSVYFKVDKSYYDNTEGAFKGGLKFSGTLKSATKNDDGTITIGGQDKLEITIKGDDIKYPDNETDRYSLKVEKSKGELTSDGKLKYTVTVTSKKGTPDFVHYEDLITADGLTLGAPNVTVEVRDVTEHRNSESDTSWWSSGGDYGAWTQIQTPNNYTYSDGQMKMDLPQMTTTEAASGLERQYQQYQITYTYDISGMGLKDYTANNTATVESEGKHQWEHVKDSSEVETPIQNSYTITKTGGTYQDGKLQWTIKVNENNLNIAGAKLTDKMTIDGTTITDVFERIEKGDITITPSNGWKYTYDDNGKKIGIEFTATDGAENKNSYTITYYTKVDQDGSSHTVKNEADFTKDNTTIGTGVIGDNNNVPARSSDKRVDPDKKVTQEGNTLTIPWRATIDFSNGKTILAGSVFATDTMTQNNGVHAMTVEQAKELAKNFKWTDENGAEISSMSFDDGTFDLVLYTSRSFKWTDAGKSLDDLEPGDLVYGFKVVANKEFTLPDGATKLVIRYNSTADITDVTGTVYYRNVFNGVGWNYEYKKASIVKTDGDDRAISSVTKSDGELVWKIKVTSDSVNAPHDTLTVVDNLPQGVKVKSIQLVFPGGVTISEQEIEPDVEFSFRNNRDTLSGKYDSAAQTLTMTLKNDVKNNLRSEYTFIIKCEAVTTPDGGKIVEGISYRYKNEASATFEDNVKIDSSSQEQEWTKNETVTPEVKPVQKSGTWDEYNKELHYSVILNPNSEALVDAKLNLTLTDTLTLPKHPSWVAVDPSPSGGVDLTKIDVEALLITNDVELFYATKDADGNLVAGAEVTGWKLQTSKVEDGNYNKYIMTITTIPNQQALILKYNYRITNNASEAYAKPTYTVGYMKVDGVQNEAVLSGLENKPDDDKVNTAWDEATGSAYMGASKILTVIKIEEGDQKTTLEGAEFTLQRYDANAGTYVNVTDAGDNNRVYVTDGQGRFNIERVVDKDGNANFELDVLYRLIETKQPDGYEMPTTEKAEEQAVYFYFGTTAKETELGSIPEYAKAIDLNEASKTVRVENTPNKTKLAVHKLWRDSAGAITPEVSNITARLHRVTYYQKPNESGYGMVLFEGKYSQYNKDIPGIDALSSQLGVVPAGTIVTLQITTTNYGTATDRQDRVTLSWNGVLQSMKAVEQKDLDPQWNHNCQTIYTYELTVGKNFNTLDAFVDTEGTNINDNVKIEIIDTAKAPELQPADDILYNWDGQHVNGEFTLSASNDWLANFENLPLTEWVNGTKVYYAYYVLETQVDGVAVSADGKEGNGWNITQGDSPVTSGTITIVNTKPDTPDEPGYELPATGSTGTTPYTAGGALIMGTALVCGYLKKRRRGKGAE